MNFNQRLDTNTSSGSRMGCRPDVLYPQDTDILDNLYQRWLASPHTVAQDPGAASQTTGTMERARERVGVVAGSGTRHLMRRASWLASSPSMSGAWDEIAKAIAGGGNVWVWSDMHLGHENIVRYAGRPFTSAGHTDAVMLANAQALVMNCDFLLFLGDISLRADEETVAWLRACPGRKMLLAGNHDKWLLGSGKGEAPKLIAESFEAVGSTLDVQLGSNSITDTGGLVERVWLTHYPIGRQWIPSGVRNMHGHIHARALGKPHVNASVEWTGYAPVPLLQLLGAGMQEAS